jgi:hypothetical protein
MFLFSIPLLVLYLTFLLSSSRNGRTTALITMMFAPLVWMACAFYVWMGVLGLVQRISSYVVYSSALVVGQGQFLGKTYFSVLLAVVVITTPLTLYIYAESPYNNTYAVLDEEAAGSWILGHSEDTQMVFTDLRLSGLLVSGGHFYVVGISDNRKDASAAPLVLDYLFYNATPGSVAQGIDLVSAPYGVEIELIFVSSRMSMQYPAIRGYDYTFKPAPASFMIDYSTIKMLNLVCDTGASGVFSISR